MLLTEDWKLQANLQHPLLHLWEKKESMLTQRCIEYTAHFYVTQRIKLQDNDDLISTATAFP